MTRPRTSARLAAGAAALAVASLALLPGAATASAAVTEVSWWTRSPLAGPPEGGFGVGAAPDGPTTVSAITVDLAGGVETLVLTAAPAGEVTGLAAIEVCLAPGQPASSSGDALEGAPAKACDGEAVPFGRAGDAWRADVSSLVAGATGTTTLAVVPAAGSGAVPYEVAFAAPTVQATGVPDDTGGREGGGTATPPPTPTTARPGGGTAAPAPPAIRLDPVTTPTLDRPGAPTAPATSAPASDPATAPAGPPGGADDGAGSAFELATGGLIDAEASAPRWGEAFLLVLIGVAVGAVVYGGSRFAEARA